MSDPAKTQAIPFRRPSPKVWYRRRTVWAAIVAVVVAIGSAILELPAEKIVALEGAILAVAAIFLRDAVEAVGKRR